jgi:hypothetical protein
MQRWMRWDACVQALAPACARQVTFQWMRIVLMGLCVRADLAGVTSLVRALALQPKQYLRLLHLFHSEALRLAPLTALWVRFCQRHFDPLEVGASVNTSKPAIRERLKAGHREARGQGCISSERPWAARQSSPLIASCGARWW